MQRRQARFGEKNDRLIDLLIGSQISHGVALQSGALFQYGH